MVRYTLLKRNNQAIIQKRTKEYSNFSSSFLRMIHSPKARGSLLHIKGFLRVLRPALLTNKPNSTKQTNYASTLMKEPSQRKFIAESSAQTTLPLKQRRSSRCSFEPGILISITAIGKMFNCEAPYTANAREGSVASKSSTKEIFKKL